MTPVTQNPHVCILCGRWAAQGLQEGLCSICTASWVSHIGPGGVEAQKQADREEDTFIRIYEAGRHGGGLLC